MDTEALKRKIGEERDRLGRMEHERLKQIAFQLRQELHGFRELFDENDPASGKAIQQFDEFVGEAWIANEAERNPAESGEKDGQ